jgi:hypothetical protein
MMRAGKIGETGRNFFTDTGVSYSILGVKKRNERAFTRGALTGTEEV